MKIRSIIIITILTSCLQVMGQSQEEIEETRFFQLSFVPMLGTNLNPPGQVTHNLSINLLAGYNKGVRGVELGGFANIDRADVLGAQFAGFTNVIGGNMTGAQGAGFVNFGKGAATGLQVSGFSNVILDSIQGVQLTGFHNQARSTTGLQASGFTNVNLEKTTGAQIAGFANSTTNLKGLQLSAFFNRAKTVNGVQFALINVADTVESGATIGLLNIVKTGLHKFQIDHQDVTDVNLSFRSGTHHFYSVLTAGTGFTEKSYWSYGAGFGSQFQITDKIITDLEVTTNAIHSHDTGYEDELNLLNRVGINFGYQLHKNLSLHAGPVLNIYVTQVYDSESGQYGYNLVDNPMFDKTYDDTAVKMWMGYNVAIRF